MIDLEASLDLKEEIISKEEFAEREEEALQCTLNTEKLFYSDQIYLTEMEMLCIRKKIRGVEDTEKIKYIDFLLHFFETYEKKCKLSDCISMYEFVMIYVVNELGNMGKYQFAIDLDKKVLKEDLLCRRTWLISNILYDIMWNKVKQGIESRKSLEKIKMTEELEQCILLSHFYKQHFTTFSRLTTPIYKLLKGLFNGDIIF